jgi:hypothetical protein
MALVVSPILMASQKEVNVPIDKLQTHRNDSGISSGGHYSFNLFDKEDSLIGSLPSLYLHKDTGEDTEDDDDDTVALPALKSAPPVAPLSSSAPQTYSPQLNLSLYSPSPSVASSVKSSSRRSSSHTYSQSTVSAASTLAAAAVAAAAAAAAAAVQTPMNNKTRKTPLYSAPCSSSALKMDIRSPPQPSQSTSRFLNAFNRFRQGHTRQSANHTNSVSPADVAIKPSPTKSSLAEKIKSKFQKQKSTVEKKTFSMPRSASLSSITQWSRRKSSSDKAMPRKVMIHSASSTSLMSQKTTLSSSSSSSTVSSASPTITAAATSAFSLTKSISSHRLYTHKSSLDGNPYRSRQPLRAVNRHEPLVNSKRRVRFTKLVSVRETYSKAEYDRGSDPDAVCSRLTPAMAQHIKEELNAYKLHEMQVHEISRIHTHFFI